MITAVEVLALHDRIIEKTGGSLGVRDPDALASALGRPFHTFGGDDVYPTPVEKAAAMLHSLCVNHPFVDGNKRTALAAAAYLLHKEGIEITVPVDDGERFMLEVAQGHHDVPGIATILDAWRRL